MCVLTYIPTINQGFILTNNRDEAIARPKAIPPKKYIIAGKEVYFPKDAQAGGTWLATSNDYTLCLLNGAFEKHMHNPPYKHSRGQIILDFFKFDSVNDFISNYTFEGIENCTIIIISARGKLELFELRWDGQHLHTTTKSPEEAHIWSSSTLYPAEVRVERERWFADFRNSNIDLSKEQVINFHLNGGTGDAQNDMRMNRNNELVTQCVFQVMKRNEYLSFSFHDLLSEQELHYRVL